MPHLSNINKGYIYIKNVGAGFSLRLACANTALFMQHLLSTDKVCKSLQKSAIAHLLSLTTQLMTTLQAPNERRLKPAATFATTDSRSNVGEMELRRRKFLKNSVVQCLSILF